MTGAPPFFAFGSPGGELAFPVQGGEPVCVTREQWEACCCNPCDCPDSCPVSADAFWLAWKEPIWEEKWEKVGAVMPDAIPGQRHKMCLRFVWVCVCGGEVQSWATVGAEQEVGHLEAVTPHLGESGQFFFALEFYGWRVQEPNLSPPPNWARTYFSSSDYYKVFKWISPPE